MIRHLIQLGALTKLYYALTKFSYHIWGLAGQGLGFGVGGWSWTDRAVRGEHDHKLEGVPLRAEVPTLGFRVQGLVFRFRVWGLRFRFKV